MLVQLKRFLERQGVFKTRHIKCIVMMLKHQNYFFVKIKPPVNQNKVQITC